VDNFQGGRAMSIPREEWLQMTLTERLIEHLVRIPDAVDMTLLADDLKEAIRRINTLRQRNLEAEAENRRLERLLHQETPY
jgi:hypothetical protein